MNWRSSNCWIFVKNSAIAVLVESEASSIDWVWHAILLLLLFFSNISEHMLRIFAVFSYRRSVGCGSRQRVGFKPLDNDE
jgi:hypothetical protein